MTQVRITDISGSTAYPFSVYISDVYGNYQTLIVYRTFPTNVASQISIFRDGHTVLHSSESAQMSPCKATSA